MKKSELFKNVIYFTDMFIYFREFRYFEFRIKFALVAVNIFFQNK